MNQPAMADAHPKSRTVVLALARECAEYIRRRNPYLRMLAISGSLTRAEHLGEHTDADFFVVAKKGRLWEAFFGCLLHGWRFARRNGLPRTFFCFNYLVDEAHPEEIDLRRAEYAREFLRLEVLAGNQLYDELLEHFQARLQSLEPGLYHSARRHAMLPEPLEGQGHGWWWRLVYRTLRLPFIAAAKWMEARRKRRYPGGFIYSNGRVIRSHFRRFWAGAPPKAVGLPASQAFSNIAATYDAAVVGSPANSHMRSLVHAVLEELTRPGMNVLDLGAGTGVDAVWLARRGAHVLAVDAAPGMVRAAEMRVSEAGLQDRVQVRQLAVQDLASLLPDHARRYDLILANSGVLNLSGEPERWAPVAARLLKRGGHLVGTVINRVSAWELLAGLLRGRVSFALRRLRNDPIQVGGVSLPTELYTPGQFVRRTARYFRVRSVSGLCTFVPPPALEHLGHARPRLWSLLCRLDRRFGGLPLVRAAGDHFLAVLQQQARPLFRRKRCGFVTAAPVVEDLNGDGCNEVVVASDRLHILDGYGRNLGGWPRRIGGPLASTPWVRREADRSAIYIGSDDNRLYALSGDGTPVQGFPVQTGGDVFSSPLVLDPPDGGHPRIIFGSDDGCLYATDGQGRVLPGWPLRTGGFISSSPVPVEIDGIPALVIGSWDGNLYAVNHSGRILPGWPRPLGFPIWSSAAVADLDGDGQAEIIVATHQLFAFRGDGTAVKGFPASLGAYAVGSPAVGDMNGDGWLEVVVGADSIYAFNADGRLLPGFPANTGAYVWASPILVDVNGDGCPEIVVGDFAGQLWAVSHKGRPVSGYPVTLGSRITASATAADLDGDRHLEVIVASADGRVTALPTECADHPRTAPWPRFLHGRHVLHRSLSSVTEQLPGPPKNAKGPVGPDPAAHLTFDVRLQPKVPRPFRVSEIHLTPSHDLRLGGLLYYTVNGTEHPSPFLASSGQCFALVQPLPPLKRVDFWCQLNLEGGGTLRIPAQGSFHFRVGVPGFYRSEEV